MIISLSSPNVFNNITYINCGITTPALSGKIDLSGLNNLEYFRCVSNGVSELSGYGTNTKLKVLILTNNLISSNFETLSNKPLEIIFAQFNKFNGSFPVLPNTLIRGIFNTNPNLTGTLPTITSLDKLEELNVSNCNLSGQLPSLTGCVSLLSFNASNQLGSIKFNGSFGNFRFNTVLKDCIINNNQISSWIANRVPITLGLFLAQNNNFNTSSVDRILQEFVTANKTSGTRVLNLGGSGNQSPSPAGIANKNILISRGWTVTTN